MEGNTEVNLNDLGLGSGSSGMAPKTWAATTGVNKLDFIKIKNFCDSETTIKKVKTQHTEWEEIFANKILDKGHAKGLLQSVAMPPWTHLILSDLGS